MDDFIARLDIKDSNFKARLLALLKRDDLVSASVESSVREIVAQVREDGDTALLRYTNELDRRQIDSSVHLEQLDFRSVLGSISPAIKSDLKMAATRIEEYHKRQTLDSWQYQDTSGNLIGQLVTPLERVGIYVPGGRAAYPSSVLMNTIPAKVAGVEEIIMVSPAPDECVDETVLAAAAIAGVDKVFSIGGAQAIAALAYGTETIPRVDKIVGPGNSYVARAKSQVFGDVGIDMVAGPSEILILCDGETEPDWIAMDLFSQAEHDEFAQAILVSPDRRFLDLVAGRIKVLLKDMPRREIILESLKRNGALIGVDSMNEAIDIANRIAPEHLELSIAEPRRFLPKIRHAGSIFLGRLTPEAFGDYCAGPNHVLPTSGSARFSSPLGVYDFQKRTSVIECSEEGASHLGRLSESLAKAEGLEAHARSAAYRSRKF
ncbi:MAG: histidinol dehydrogenase [Gammaproteobacteria bacterium]